MLTDKEILELETLLDLQKKDELFHLLRNPNEKDSNPNYLFLFSAINQQKYNEVGELLSGYRGAILEGSSRSGKTYSGVDIIIYLGLEDEGCVINIVRETYAEFKETLYDDFKRRLDDYRLPNPFHNAKEVKTFKIGKSTVRFLGSDKIGKKHGAGCDYLFFNEMVHIERGVFDQLEMRCRKFWWGDYNPSVTEHYIFNSVIPRADIGFLRTTFKDNPFISTAEKNKILSYEPWLPGSYDIREADLLYNGELISEKNQPPPHPVNVQQGTADEFMWKVYGLGLRGAMKGIIFNAVEWIDEFPSIAYTYANDFGFTADPNALVRYAEDENNIWVEPLCYTPIETPDELSEYMKAIGVEKYKPIACDSSDKYTGENKGTVEMVKGLSDLGWKASKISKTKSVMYWILSMKQKKIHIVRNQFYKNVKAEQENYRFKEVQGIMINQPIDAFNHFWDAARYGHMSHNDQRKKAFGSKRRIR